MKIRALLFVTVIFLFPTIALSAEVRRDGNWWLLLKKYQRDSYVVGFFDGMQLGNNFSWWKYSEGTEIKQDCVTLATNSYDEYVQKYLRNVTSRQLSDGLDNFYANYKNRRIVVLGAVWIVVNGIVGTPEKELNRLIEFWRMNSVNHN